MHRIDPLHQDLLIDPFEFLGPKRRERLETGWPALFRRTIEKFLRVMRREHLRLLRKYVADDLGERYRGEKNGFFAQVKPSEAAAALEPAAEDLYRLVETFRAHPTIRKLSVFFLLQRVLNEQCNVLDNGGEAKVEIKDPQAVVSDSLQNPSDPDAGYSGHKGEGYPVQLMETYQEEEAAGQSETPNLITYLDIQPARA